MLIIFDCYSISLEFKVKLTSKEPHVLLKLTLLNSYLIVHGYDSHMTKVSIKVS